MKHFILLLFLSTLSFSDYGLFLKGDQIGTIKNLDGIYKGYLLSKLTFSARLYAGEEFVIFYEKGFKPEVTNSVYKEDKGGLLIIGRLLKSMKLKRHIEVDNEKQFIKVICKYKNSKNYSCKFARQNKGDMFIYRGNLVVKNSKLDYICENRTNMCLRKLK